MQEYVLVVEDDKIYRERLLRSFNDRGLLTLGASSRNEASILSREYSIRWAVIDLLINSESGLTVLEEILMRHPTAKCVILTGYGTIKTAVDAVKMGAAQYLTKPIDLLTILQSLGINTALDSAPLQRAALDPTPTLDQVEWDYIQRVLNYNSGNITAASKALGLPRRSLQRKLQKDPGKLT